jgi:hypothetical protein
MATQPPTVFPAVTARQYTSLCTFPAPVPPDVFSTTDIFLTPRFRGFSITDIHGVITLAPASNATVDYVFLKTLGIAFDGTTYALPTQAHHNMCETVKTAYVSVDAVNGVVPDDDYVASAVDTFDYVTSRKGNADDLLMFHASIPISHHFVNEYRVPLTWPPTTGFAPSDTEPGFEARIILTSYDPQTGVWTNVSSQIVSTQFIINSLPGR